MVILLNQTFTVEWYMARLVVKNGHQKDMCHNEGGVCAQNYYHHSRSSMKLGGPTYVITYRERQFD